MPDVHPNIAEHYRAKVIRLAETLAEPESNGEAREDTGLLCATDGPPADADRDGSGLARGEGRDQLTPIRHQIGLNRGNLANKRRIVRILYTNSGHDRRLT
jgi:hypothetical protein